MSHRSAINVPELQLRQLEKQLDYRFLKPELLLQALTHRSVGAVNNERLEFLGDSILNFTAAAALYEVMADADEGTLSRYRALLVKGDTLAEIANELGLFDLLILGEGELKSGGHRRKSTLADSVEAIIGAVYLDSGMEPATRLVNKLLASRLANLPKPDELKDPKTRLQEYMQKEGLELPVYELIGTYGKAHEQQFEVSCLVADQQLTKGIGSSRRRAEQEAAAKMLNQLS
jgi:ribonuclease-3